jgi:hypothetical protein
MIKFFLISFGSKRAAWLHFWYRTIGVEKVVAGAAASSSLAGSIIGDGKRHLLVKALFWHLLLSFFTG